MTSNEVVVAMIDALDAAGVAYMLVGAYSCNVHGVPRSTKDADFVVQVTPDQMARIRAHLDRRFELDPQMSFECVAGTLRHVFRVAGVPFRIELFCLSDDPHDQERFRRRQVVRHWDRDVYYPTPEDVLIPKLRWAKHARRAKDADDARTVVAVQSDSLDWNYIYYWCDQHGTRELLDELRRNIPEV